MPTRHHHSGKGWVEKHLGVNLGAIEWTYAESHRARLAAKSDSELIRRLVSDHSRLWKEHEALLAEQTRWLAERAKLTVALDVCRRRLRNQKPRGRSAT